MSGNSKLGLGLISAAVASAASCWTATQWTAARLNYQASLDPAVLEGADFKLYAPWRLFDWWIAYGGYAPNLFAQGGVIAAGGALVGAGLSRLAFASAKPSKTTYGSARWASVKEVKAAGLLAGTGLYLGAFNGRDLRHDGPDHVIALAPTRSGKGVGLVIPTLLSWTGSVIVHDIKAENWRLTAGWRSQFSQCLLFDPTSPFSARYNPLSEVRRGLHEVRDAQNIADILVDPDGVLERRSHWDKTSHALLVGAILHVLYAEDDKSLAGVARLLADPSRSFEATLSLMMETHHLDSEQDGPAGPSAEVPNDRGSRAGDSVAPVADTKGFGAQSRAENGKRSRDGQARGKPHPVVAACAQEVLNKSDNERSGVLSTALSFLTLYRDPLVAMLTSTCDFHIADLVRPNAPISLYLATPPSDLSRTRPLMRLMLNQIGRRLTEVLPVRATPRLLMMLDEFAALGRLEFFETALAYMAGFGVRVYLIAQSLNQLSKAYGENSAILDNCHVRIVFACNDERAARRISDALGASTIERAQTSHSGDRFAAWLSHVSISQQETARPLLTPGEVMQLPADKALILSASLAPILADKMRYHQDERFVRRLLPPPPPRPKGHGKPDPWAGQSALPRTPAVKAPGADGADDDDGWLTPQPQPPSPADLFAVDSAAQSHKDAAMARLRSLGDLS